MNKIQDHIKLKEGCRLVVYADTRGFATVGYGHKVTEKDGLKLGDKITQEKANDIFAHDFFWVLTQVQQIILDFSNKPEAVKIVCCDMAFNNGIAGFRQFRKFIHYINLGDYGKAADEIVDSANYRSRDLAGRYRELETMVRKAV